MVTRVAVTSSSGEGKGSGSGESSGDGGGEGLGWEFRFLVPISGTPIISGIPILFSIPKIPVGKYFFNSDVRRVRYSEFRFRNSEFRYLIRKQILIPP
jgi:hypothetical protein